MKYLIILVLTLSFPVLTSLSTEASETKRALVVELMGIQGAASTELIKQIVREHRSERPNLPEKFWKDFEQSLSKIYKTYEEKVVQLYIANYSEQTLKDTVAFYKTKSGQDFVLTTQRTLLQNQELIEQLNVELMSTVIEKLDEQRAEAVTPNTSK